MDRRTLVGVLAAAGATLPLLNRIAIAQTSLKTRNVVFVHGLFADGSCWSKVIARLQKEGVYEAAAGNGAILVGKRGQSPRPRSMSRPSREMGRGQCPDRFGDAG